MKSRRGSLPQDSARNDNFRAKRKIAKYTIDPALAHGFSHEVGSIEVRKGGRADGVETGLLCGKTRANSKSRVFRVYRKCGLGVSKRSPHL